MSLSLQSCCLETLIGLAHSHGFGCSLLVSLGNKSNLPLVRGLRIIRTSYQLDARLEKIMSGEPRCTAGVLLILMLTAVDLGGASILLLLVGT